MLALILAAPFILLILIGVVAGMRRSLRTAQQREKFRQEIAERRGRFGGPHS